jgi:hypothetical protein
VDDEVIGLAVPERHQDLKTALDQGVKRGCFWGVPNGQGSHARERRRAVGSNLCSPKAISAADNLVDERP